MTSCSAIAPDSPAIADIRSSLAAMGLVLDVDSGPIPGAYVERWRVFIDPEHGHDHWLYNGGGVTLVAQQLTDAGLARKASEWRLDHVRYRRWLNSGPAVAMPAENVALRSQVVDGYQRTRGQLEDQLARLDAEHARTVARLDEQDAEAMILARNDAFWGVPEPAEEVAARDAAEANRAAAERIDRLTAAAAVRGLLLHKATVSRLDDDGLAGDSDVVWTLRGRATQPDIRQHLTGGSHVSIGGRVLPNPPAGTHFSTGGYELPWAGPNLDSIEWFLSVTNPTAPTPA